MWRDGWEPSRTSLEKVGVCPTSRREVDRCHDVEESCKTWETRCLGIGTGLQILLEWITWSEPHFFCSPRIYQDQLFWHIIKCMLWHRDLRDPSSAYCIPRVRRSKLVVESLKAPSFAISHTNQSRLGCVMGKMDVVTSPWWGGISLICMQCLAHEVTR